MSERRPCEAKLRLCCRQVSVETTEGAEHVQLTPQWLTGDNSPLTTRCGREALDDMPEWCIFQTFIGMQLSDLSVEMVLNYSCVAQLKCEAADFC